MALMVERIVDGGVHAEEAVGRCCRLEPLHLALSPPHDLVGVLGPIIFAKPLVVTTGQTEVSERGAAGPQLSVTTSLGATPCFLSSLRMSLSAARLLRRRCTSMSRISPS